MEWRPGFPLSCVNAAGFADMKKTLFSLLLSFLSCLVALLLLEYGLRFVYFAQ